MADNTDWEQKLREDYRSKSGNPRSIRLPARTHIQFDGEEHMAHRLLPDFTRNFVHSFCPSYSRGSGWTISNAWRWRSLSDRSLYLGIVRKR
jgi:hypothetical protein